MMKRTKRNGKYFPLGVAFSVSLFMVSMVLAFACKKPVDSGSGTPQVKVEFGKEEKGGTDLGSITAMVGTRTLISPCTVDKGSEITFKTEITTGKKAFLKGWTNNGMAVNGSNVEYKVTADKDMSIKAIFQKLKEGQCKVTFSSFSTNGKVKANDGSREITSPAGVNAGTEVTFTADPKAGYKAGIWTKDGVVVDNTGNTYKIAVMDDVTVKASFIPEADVFHQIQFKLEGAGAKLEAFAKVDGVEVPFTSSAKLPARTEVVFKATLEDPQNSYVQWEGASEAGSVGAVSKAMLIVAGDATVTARIKPKTEDDILVSFGPKGGLGGKVKAMLGSKEISSPYTAKTGDKIKFTAEPDTANNWQFVSWEGVTATSTDPLVAEVTVGKTPINVFAIFKQYIQISFSVAGDATRGTLSVKSANGTELSSPYSAVMGELLTFTASPADIIKHTTKWSELEGFVVDSNNTRLATLTVTKPGAISVEFIDRPKALLKVKITGEGKLQKWSAIGYVGDWAGHQLEGKYWVYNLVERDEPNFDKNSVIDEKGKEVYVGAQFQLSVSSEEDSEEPTVTAEGTEIKAGQNGGHEFTVSKETLITVDVKKKPKFDIQFATDGANKEHGKVYMRGKQKQGGGSNEYEKLEASPQQAFNGQNITLVAEPERGWRVEKWCKDGADIENETRDTYSFGAEGAAKYTVHFISNTENECNLTLNPTGDGTLKAEVNGKDIPTGNKIYKGERLKITAVPNGDGKMVKSWKVTHNSVNMQVENDSVTGDLPLTFEIHGVLGDVVVEVEFMDRPTYEVKFKVANGGGEAKIIKLKETVGMDGQVNVSEEDITSNATAVLHGTKVEFRAVPQENYRVAKWEGISAQGINKARAIVKSAYDVTVTFESTAVTDDNTDVMIPLRFSGEISMPTGGKQEDAVNFSDDLNSYSHKKPFEMGKYEVTYELYKKVVDWTETYNTEKKKNKSEEEIAQMLKKHELYNFVREDVWNVGTVNETKVVRDNRGMPGTLTFKSQQHKNSWFSNYEENAKKYIGIPITNFNKKQPAVYMEYTAALIWCNAYSEMCGFEPCYKVSYFDGESISGVLRNVQIPSGVINVPDYISWDEDSCGYRLPTHMEWELAARLSKDAHGENTFGDDRKCTVNDTEYYFTKGFVPSGFHRSVAKDTNTEDAQLATKDEYRKKGRFLSVTYSNKSYPLFPAGTLRVNYDDGVKYAPKAKDATNDLGFVYMVGNASEYVWNLESGMKGGLMFYKGADWTADWIHLSLGDICSQSNSIQSTNIGFRLCRTLD